MNACGWISNYTCVHINVLVKSVVVRERSLYKSREDKNNFIYIYIIVVLVVQCSVEFSSAGDVLFFFFGFVFFCIRSLHTHTALRQPFDC